jgi:outer membrane protein assembly factor BamB
MKGNDSRILAMIVITSILLAGYSVMIFQTPMQVNDVQTEDIIPNNPIIPTIRSTRAGTDWPMHLQNALHTSFTPDSGPSADNVIWFNATGGQTYSSPAVVGDRVYIGSEDGGSNYGWMTAYYKNNGTRIWRTRTISAISGGYGLTSSPAVDNGYVFFGGDRLYSLWETNGTIKWTIWTGNNEWGDGTPTVANNKVFMPGSDRKLYCIEQDTGNVLWTFQTLFSGSSNYGLYAPPAIYNGYVYLSAPDHNVYMIAEIQPTSIATADYIFPMAATSYSAPVVANGRVFVGCGYTGTSSSNRFYALDATDLSLIWEFYPGSPTSFFSSAGFYNDRIYVGSVEGNLYVLDAMSSGPSTTVIWQYNIGSTWGSPAITDNKMYIGSSSNHLYCFNLTQPPIPAYYWRANTLGDVDSSPAISDGIAYVGTQGGGGSIYAIGEPPSPPPTVDSIEIRTQPGGGGIPIPDVQTVDVGEQVRGYAAAYNDSTGFLNDIPVTWSVINDAFTNASTTPLVSSTFSDFYSGFFGGSAQWIANDGSGHTDLVDFTINPPEVDYIQIVDSPGTGMQEITDSPVDVGYSLTGYAAEFNNTIGYLNDVFVTWSVINDVSTNASTNPTSSSITSDFYSGFYGGLVQWTANDGSGHTDSVFFTINPPEVDYIQIVDTEGTGASEILNDTFDVGYSNLGFAAGYNNTVGYFKDVSVTWSVINSSAEGFTLPALGTNSTLNVGNLGGTVQWIADYGIHSDSVTFTVNDPTIDYIMIRSAASGGGSWVGDTTLLFDETTIFYAAGYNDTAGFVMDVPASWSSDDTLVGDVFPLSGTSTLFTAVDNGTCVVTADYTGKLNSSGVISVINYTIDYIIIRDLPGGIGNPVGDRTFSVDDTANFFAAAYNSSAPGDGYLGDVAVTWESNDTAVGTVTTPGTSTMFIAQTLGGDCFVTARLGPIISDSTGTLTVNTATLDYIRITDAYDGNDIITVTLDVGQQVELFASGYNNTGVYVGPVSVQWSQSPSILGSFNPDDGSSSIFTSGSLGGATTILASNTTEGVSDDFGLEVNDPSVDYIIIRDAPNGAGNVVTGGYYSVYEVDEFYAAAYNYTSDYLYDITALWTIDESEYASVTTPGYQTNFSAHLIDSDGICRVTAYYTGGISNVTGPLIILAPKVDYILIRDTPNGGGNEVTEGYYPVYGEDEFYAAAYNDTIDYLYDVTVTWSVDDSTMATVTSPGLWTNFSAKLMDSNGICYVTANYTDGISYVTGALAVWAPSVDELEIIDLSGNSLTSLVLDVGEWIHCYIKASNDTVGLLENIQVNWYFESSMGSLSPSYGVSTNLSAESAGDANLVAIYDITVSHSIDVTINDLISQPTGLIVTPVSGGGALNLVWNANSEANLAGYHIYRSLSRNGEYAKLNSEPILDIFFIDDNVANGVRYFYYIVAEDTDGKLSDLSEKADGIADVDTDSDGLLDYADPDDDDDGLSDFEEAVAKTNPKLADTDGDGYSDSDDFYPLDSNKWEEEEEAGIPLLLLLIPIILLVIILLLFLILAKRKKDKTPPPYGPQLVPPPSSFGMQTQQPPVEEKVVELRGVEIDDLDDEEPPPPED